MMKGLDHFSFIKLLDGIRDKKIKFHDRIENSTTYDIESK